jgi:hypothetical protein
MIMENPETLLVSAKEIGLNGNACKSKYMVMSQDQNAGRSDSMEFDNVSFQRVEEFKTLGTRSKDQNSIQDEVD